MYRDNKVGLTIPAYNEERLIGPTLDAVPEIIDVVYVVNDCSTDSTADVVRQKAVGDPRIVLVEWDVARGVVHEDVDVVLIIPFLGEELHATIFRHELNREHGGQRLAVLEEGFGRLLF